MAARRGPAARPVDHAAPARRPAGRRAGLTRQGRGSDRVSTTRSSPGPAWSRDRWALAPSALWKASAAALSGRVTAWTTRAPVLRGQVVEPPAQPAAEPRPAPVGPHGEQVQVRQPVGGHHAEHVADVLAAGGPGDGAEAAELVEPHRVVQRPGVGVPEPVVARRAAGPGPPSRTARRSRRRRRRPLAVIVRRARRRPPPGWAGRRRPACSSGRRRARRRRPGAAGPRRAAPPARRGR